MPRTPQSTKCRELGCKNEKTNRSCFCADHGGGITEKGKQNSKLYSTSYWKQQRISQLSIIEDASDTPDALTMISEILEDTLQLVDVIKIAHKNATEQECYGLLNYLEQRLDDHWKFIWMLRATLEPQK